jgi:hypothetical protein
MDDLKKELASLRLDDEPPRSRRGAWANCHRVSALASESGERPEGLISGDCVNIGR